MKRILLAAMLTVAGAIGSVQAGVTSVPLDEPGVLPLLGILAVGALGVFLRRRK